LRRLGLGQERLPRILEAVRVRPEGHVTSSVHHHP
jgi:hypothetical protein